MIFYISVHTKLLQLCLTLCDPTDWSLPGSSVHGILQARTLEWVAMPSSRGSSQPRDQTQISCIAGGFFTVWATREAQEYWSGYPIPSPVDLPNAKLTWNAISTKERQFDPPLSPRDQEINLPVKVPPCARRLRRRPLSPEFGISGLRSLYRQTLFIPRVAQQ